MAQFSLNMNFDEKDLDLLWNTGSKVVIAKPSEDGSPNVCWVVFRPMVDNRVTWEEEYGIYASNTEIQSGAELFQISRTEFPALVSHEYELGPAGYFSSPKPGGAKNLYTAVNQYDNSEDKGYMTIGLYQDAVVNGQLIKGNAVSAASVLYRSTAVMETYTTVYIWTQSQVESNTVVTKVTSPMRRITLSASAATANLRYDRASGCFADL